MNVSVHGQYEYRWFRIPNRDSWPNPSNQPSNSMEPSQSTRVRIGPPPLSCTSTGTCIDDDWPIVTTCICRANGIGPRIVATRIRHTCKEALYLLDDKDAQYCLYPRERTKEGKRKSTQHKPLAVSYLSSSSASTVVLLITSLSSSLLVHFCV